MIDSHCHIAGPEFASDLQEVVTRAKSVGVTRALVILAADDESEIEQAAAVAANWPEARFSIGVHPHGAGKFAADPSSAATLVQARIEARPDVRALGEIGLDYHYDFSPRGIQQEVFRVQIRVARRLGLPLVIHTREAEDDTFRILDEECAEEAGGVFHCFTGDRDMARRALEIDFYVSFAGIVTFPRALELKEVAKIVPLDRLLIETDSPFLAPAPHRGGRNEPAHVRRIAEAIGELRGVPPEAVGDAARANFDRLFKP